jgi:hypothetical protein
MRAGESVIVCGAHADRAQFEPFEWPEYAVVWVGVGCGSLHAVMMLPPAPEDASAAARDEVARAYVRAVRGAPVDRERAARGVSSWLALVERAARVPCAVVFACGGVRVSAIPIFRVVWSRLRVLVSGATFRVTERRNGDEVAAAHRILAERGIALREEYTVVPCGARSIEMRPHQRCALCDTPMRSSIQTFVTAREHPDARSWLPRLSVCAACPARSFRLWRTFEFTIADDIAEPRGPHATLLEEGAHESAWQAGGRVVVTLALALAARAVPSPGTFAAALTSALRDLKLLRIVAERLAPPTHLAAAAPRALGVLLERR